MPRIATVRNLLALIGILLLLVNPAGICAGTMGSANSPSHPCCPQPGLEKAPCLCIDRQPAAPTLPPLADQPQLAVVAVAPVADVVVAALPEPVVERVVGLAPDALLLSIHQLLL
jgi:hypothetical protein